MEHEHHEHAHSHEHQPAKKDNIIASSIIVGAILISASIFYNTKLVIQSFGGKSLGVQGSAQNIQPQQQAAPVPQGPVDVAERKDAPKTGRGKVVIEEFSDFQCPFCQKFFNDTYKQIKTKYIDTGKATFVFRHFPLPIHQNAQKAGEAAECANRQGKFFPYHDRLFEKMQPDGTGLNMADLKQYAVDLGLNVSKFNTCLDNGETAEVVKKDITDGQAAGVSGTPTVFVNGVKIVVAQPFSSFEQAIEQALKQ
ncbi:MAG: DsbA family protein [Patescibacteria group bacterium]